MVSFDIPLHVFARRGMTLIQEGSTSRILSNDKLDQMSNKPDCIVAHHVHRRSPSCSIYTKSLECCSYHMDLADVLIAAISQRSFVQTLTG
jgi:hypothetical protein